MMRKGLGTAAILAGLALLLSAAALCGYNVHTEQRAGEARDAIVLALSDQIPALEPAGQARESSPEYTPEPETGQPAAVMERDAAAGELPVVTVDGMDYVGVLSIPALGLELPVLHDWSYAHLRVSPAIYHGSVLTGDLVICGHNYSTHFGTLRNLTEGDYVLLYAADGRVFSYQISAIEIVSPLSTADVISGQWPLTLFTCTVGGRTRLVIRCDEIS